MGLIAFSFTQVTETNRPTSTFERDDSEAKFWLDPIRLERSHGFSRKEINQIQAIVTRSQQGLLDQWNEYFNG